MQGARPWLASSASIACLAVASGGACAQQDAGWTAELTPFVWAAGMKGDVGIGQVQADGVEMSFPDIAKSLRAGFMGSIEGRKGPLGLFAEAIYMDLTQTHPAPHDFLGDVHAQVKQQGYALAALWRVAEGPQAVDLCVGARDNDIKADLSLSSSALAPGGRRRVASRSWVDGYVGARVLYPVSGRWTLLGYADIGAGGSDSTWQVMAGANYAISPTASAKLGYRLLKVDYHKDDFLYDMSSGGLYAGVGFLF